jgi:insulysin
MIFEVDSAIPQYHSMELDYVGFLMSYKYNQTLTTFLKERNYGQSIQYSVPLTLEGYSLFQISVTLTDIGKFRVYNVINAIFAFFKMVRGYGIDENKYKELKQITKTKFLYQERDKSIKVEAQKLASQWLKYPQQYIFEAQ